MAGVKIRDLVPERNELKGKRHLQKVQAPFFLPDEVGDASQHESPGQRPLSTLSVQLHVPLPGEGHARGIGGRSIRVFHSLANLQAGTSNLN